MSKHCVFDFWMNQQYLEKFGHYDNIYNLIIKWRQYLHFKKLFQVNLFGCLTNFPKTVLFIFNRKF